MNKSSSMCKSVGSRSRFHLLVVTFALAVAGCVSRSALAASNYVPPAVATATSSLYSNGSTSMSPGRVAVDKAGNVFYINHVSPYTLWEIPAATPSAPQILLTGLGQYNSNSVFVDAGGTLWVSDGNGSAAMFEVPATNGIPNVAGITGNGNYSSTTGLPVSAITTACTASPASLCVWSNGSFASNVSGGYIQVCDVFSDGAGNVFVVDVYDNTSKGGYNRVVRFNTSTPATGYLIGDNLKENTDAQVTVAGDGNVYYVDSAAYYSSPTGVTDSLGAASSTSANAPAPVGTTATLGAAAQITSATGVATDAWGNLIVSGTLALMEVPLENGSLSFADEFCLVNATGQSATTFPIFGNNITYGGTLDSHGSYYYASSTNIMQVQVGGYNFGSVPVGTLKTGAYIDFYINLLIANNSYAFPTFTIPSLSAANYGLLQSFPFSGTKTFASGNAAYGPTGSNGSTPDIVMDFQPVHAGLLRGAFTPLNNTSPLSPWVTVNLQGVGAGAQTMLLPGTASTAIAKSQVYTSSAHSASATSFTPQGLAVDSYGDIFMADSANHTVDVDCLATTAAAAQAAGNNPTTGIYCQGNAGYTFELGTSFISPVAVAMDGANAVYVLDSSSNSGTNPVTKLISNSMAAAVIVPNGTTIGGAALNNPQGIALDGYGNIYIADTGNNRIVQAHQFNAPYSQNVVYVPSTMTFGGSKLSSPAGVAVDAAGDLFIADTGNNRVVEYSVTGVGSVVSASGIALKSPSSIAVLPSGALIVSDQNNNVSLIDAGVGSALKFATSTGSMLTLNTPGGVALDLSGNIYATDSMNSRVVELNVNTPATMPTYPTTAVGSDSADIDLYVYNAGTSALSFSAAPALSDTVDFAIDPVSAACKTGSPVAAGLNCALAVYFQPQSVGVLSTTATLTDNQAIVSGTSAGSSGNPGQYGYLGTFAASSMQMATFSSTFTPQTITFVIPGTQTVGTPLTLVGSTTATGLTVSFSSSTTSVCTVSGTTAAFIASGSCTITASQAGNSIYGPASVSQTFAVNGEPQAITFTNPGAQFYAYGMTLPLSASTTATGLTVAFTSGTTSVCTVSGTTLSILATGTCTITASQSGSSVYAAATSVVQSFSITNAAPVIAGLSTTYVSWGAPMFTLTINGSGFVGSTLSGSTAPTTTVYWDSTALATTYVSPTQLTAVVHVFNTDSAGVHAITVESPAPGGGTSNTMQFEVDSEAAAPAPPNFTATTAAVTAGSTASYAVTLPATATNVSVVCLNLPSGASCSYSASQKALSIATTASTPKGTYQVAVVFTETLPGAVVTTAFVLLPFLLTPLSLRRKKLASRGILYTVCIGMILSGGAALFSGCGGSASTSTHQVTSSGGVTLTVQ